MDQIQTTATSPAQLPLPAKPLAGRSLWGDAIRRLRRDKGAMICLAVILIYASVALVSKFAFSDWANQVNYENTNAPPSSANLLGTDEFGRSIAQKTALGAYVSLSVGFWANVIAIPLGMLLGAISGYYNGRFSRGGFIDDGIVWLYTTLTAVPGLILVIAVKFAFQDKVFFSGTFLQLNMDGMAGIVLALSIAGWTGTCRLVRAEVMKIRELDYIIAARASGRRSFSILLRHVMPNVFHIGIISFSLGFVGAIMAEVTLSYLGLGIQDMPSWGKMIDSARMDLVVGRYSQIAAAVAATFAIVLAWNIFGDRLRDALDPKLKNV